MSPNVNGDVIIPVVYTKEDVTGQVSTTKTYGTEQTNENIVPDSEDNTKGTKTSDVTATEKDVKSTTFTYYLKEIAGSRAGMTYDDSEIKVEVTVTYTETYTYTATRTVAVVWEENGDVSDGTPTGEWKESGEASYSARPTTGLTPVVTITSTVKYADNAELTAATFNNRYDANPAKATIVGEKTYNRNMTAGQFTFNLYETDSTFALAANAQVKDTATVDAVSTISGVATDAFGFAEITYDKAGTYYYVVKEAMPAGATAANNYTVDGITYDQTENHVTVVVSLEAGTNLLHQHL